MTEKQLVQKLNNLREIQPDASWLKANRDSLFAQVSNSGAKDLTSWSSFVINFSSLVRTVSMPAMAIGSFMLFILVSSIFSHLLLVNAKPNDSLYIARVISERAKLNTILNTESRDKMAAQFATSHAQDIMTVLSDPTFNNNEADVAKLNESFKNEINTAKQSIAKVKTTNPTIASTSTSNAVTVATASDEVFSAALLKDEKGVSMDVVASSSDQILEEVNTLFDKKDYDQAKKVLELINK